MKYIDGFREGQAGRFLGKEIKKSGEKLAELGKHIKIMEVCGSHTMAISRYGIRQMLPDNIQLLSGPGCPVCVTDSAYIDAAIELALSREVIIVTFGDMVRVPGKKTTLAGARSEGADIRICYSPLEAITVAKENPAKEVVFLAIGFETTMVPCTALAHSIVAQNISNLSLLTAFKLVPPALTALITDPEINVEAFISPAHVSAIIGSEAYRPFVDDYDVPCVICGFEPLDILYGIDNIAKQFLRNKKELVNQYSRVVRPQGNVVAQNLMAKYLKPIDASWRGIGVIPQSGLDLKANFDFINAEFKFGVSTQGGTPNPACKCGDVLKGKITPDQCGIFSKVCTPSNPVGPCMVSSEGSCAAFYKYERK